ncbi:MAG TPA: T9SS type A sorting domain-containing protein [bacterium]|nr:T9SS type A sorting domain-containing protein [bacterium]HQG45728.1 T9SS type A sorting domain-containing protein [bacterium]HQI48478.1 T9SS type A sorting domain-containing protein [bacterium]HQJ64943.1 T9SS type A sorting domain-containing protein [bacterium]
MPRRFLLSFSALCSFGAFLAALAAPLHAIGVPGARILAAPLAAPRLAQGAVRILALRVEFVADAVATTTGTGRFDYSTTATHPLDRPPHNRTYFQHQLLGLANYFARVSGGRVQISSDVFPEAENEAYQLQHDMVWYSGTEDEKLQQQRWAELLRDALQLAAAGGGIDFSRYDALMVFHAGAGQDFAFDIDYTPYDIQSVYMDAAALAGGLGLDPATFKGIACPGGVYFHDGIILPETQNQESYDLGLLGTMTLLFGSQLGMPSLFDTRSGRAGIGSWGLMDQGSYNFQGYIPAEPSAWEKIWMGWETPVVVQSGRGVRIGTSHTVSAPHIIKVPVTSSEYYLIENRQRDPNKDHRTIGRDESGKKAEFDSTGRVVAASGIGVLTRVDEYDFGLPGNGLLIWHIDEKVIQANLASNTVNGQIDHRGVDLVECDGAQDIGYVYSMLDAGYGTENGDWWDPWWSGNESHLYVNHADAVVFSDSSIPSSNGYNDAVTRIRFDHFSGLDTVMTLDISSGAIKSGFPRLEALNSALDPATLSGRPGKDATTGLITAATREGQLYLWRSDGGVFLSGGGYVAAWPLAAPAGAPLFADLDQNGTDELYYPAVTGELYAYNLAEKASAPGLLDLRGIVPLSDSGIMRLAVLGGDHPALLLGDSRGRISLLRYDGTNGPLKSVASFEGNGSAVSGLAVAPDGLVVAACNDGLITALRLEPLTLLWQRQSGLGPSQPLIADFDGVAGYEIAALDSNGVLASIAIDGTLLGRYQAPVRLSGAGRPALGDIDLDGLPEILCATREGAAAFEFNGALVLNFPVASPSGGGIPASPLFIKAKQGNEAWLLFAGGDGLIHACNRRGKTPAGFPLGAGTAAGAALLLEDLDGDGTLDLAAAGTDGSLNLFDPGLQASDNSVWGEAGGAQRTFCLPGSSVAPTPVSDLLPARKVFCYPNPAAEGQATIRFTLSRPADAVRVRIFDLAGNFVEELKRTGLGPGDHEIVWNVARVQSGVYLARVIAETGSTSRFEIIKIAVTN